MILGPAILGILTGALAFGMLWSTGALIALIGAQLVASMTAALGTVLLARNKGASHSSRSVSDRSMWQFSEPSLEDLLSEPIVRLLMSADGVDEEAVRRVASAAPVEHGSRLIRPDAVCEDRREATREDTFARGRIEFTDGRPAIHCIIHDLSGAGARLGIPDGTALPEFFNLYSAGMDRTMLAKVRWYTFDQVGVEFVDSPAASVGDRETSLPETDQRNVG